MLSVRCGGARPQADALIELSPPFNGTTHPSCHLSRCDAHLKQVFGRFWCSSTSALYRRGTRPTKTPPPTPRRFYFNTHASVCLSALGVRRFIASLMNCWKEFMVTLTISPLRFPDDPAESSQSRGQEELQSIKVAPLFLDYSEKGILDVVWYYNHASDLEEPSVCMGMENISLYCFLTLLLNKSLS